MGENTLFKKNTLVKLYLLCLILFLIALFTAYFYTDPVSNVNNLNRNIQPDFFQIFFNNIKVATLLVFLGPLTLSLGTIAVLIINGLILGNAIGNIKDNLNLLLLVIPHGIIEVPVLLLAASVGMKLTLDLLLLKINLKFTFKYTAIIFLGLIIAATLETFITPIFIKGVS
ncbi:stage II sporulation protein M [Pseudomonas sp. ISL-88]|uniref:stage II sporulation protein M n=1 Tax=Bacteria TaxID=2 RepID=UPI001BE7AA13|nr:MULTISPECIES: stage II sporulation protein M [Bacteria]MBT2633988.1 stage II sporulation protein M [Bacillus sp. ISL-26]MBT2713545.1 stage II sporulation protein M [Pseudomonas sp. ISL-88]